MTVPRGVERCPYCGTRTRAWHELHPAPPPARSSTLLRLLPAVLLVAGALLGLTATGGPVDAVATGLGLTGGLWLVWRALRGFAGPGSGPLG